MKRPQRPLPRRWRASEARTGSVVLSVVGLAIALSVAFFPSLFKVGDVVRRRGLLPPRDTPVPASRQPVRAHARLLRAVLLLGRRSPVPADPPRSDTDGRAPHRARRSPGCRRRCSRPRCGGSRAASRSPCSARSARSSSSIRVAGTEPMHPGSMIALTLSVLAYALACYAMKQGTAALVVIGAAIGALAMMKINVGIFAAAGDRHRVGDRQLAVPEGASHRGGCGRGGAAVLHHDAEAVPGGHDRPRGHRERRAHRDVRLVVGRHDRDIATARCT